MIVTAKLSATFVTWLPRKASQLLFTCLDIKKTHLCKQSSGGMAKKKVSQLMLHSRTAKLCVKNTVIAHKRHSMPT